MSAIRIESHETEADLQRLVRIAARAVGRAKLAHAYGHCSVRVGSDRFLVCAAKPMGLITLHDLGTEVSVHGDLPPGVLGEVRIHQEIYRRHPDIGGIVRSMPPTVMSLSAARRTPRCLHGIGTYFGAGAPLWDDPQLIRTSAQAEAVVDVLGSANAVVMRGNGAVVTGGSLEEAVVLTWYLEDAARVDQEVRAANLDRDAAMISINDAALRATYSGRIIERMWEYLTFGDPEAG
ncbi:class II aldolase/adducin family protein [Cupriavidus sp. L7L]|uniref:class II aldolase/adducin family protein n=1 Tax=Cupriavidus sp. L7L TaxID=2546443 RepID=UPI001055EBF8|nr:class II aldolase/adducin family protein [Cupriavidus sp. L7L]TDF64941.1 class II aldolase/adducin family protein [Cupriavidus sp. L7L]